MVSYFASIMKSALLFFIILLCTHGLIAQSINTEFGKNRVQFHDDFNDWWEYETENFITYWYGKARYVAQHTLQMAEIDHDAIQKLLEHRMNDKIEIIVYVDISDLKQSNIGTEETFTNKTGETKIVGNKMFVYFDGNHLHLRQKIKEGIATVYFNNMLFGSNLQEIIQNAVLMNIPDWYRQGLVAYAASNWNNNVEDEMRDIWDRDKKFHTFNKMADLYPKVAGNSFWFFIDQNYGKSAISNLLYLTKISRGIENSFEYILNADLPSLKDEWSKFYTQYFLSEKNRYAPKSDSDRVKISNKKYIPVSNLKLSPDGKQLLYVYNDQGKFRVMLRDIKTGAEKRIFKYGYKNVFQETDYNYPLLAWHPTKPEISIVYEHKDVIKLIKYKTETFQRAEQIIPTDFQRIYSISYLDDLNYIFSASTAGFSDLFLYKSKNRNYEHITNDFYDDLDAEYVEMFGSKGILFSSNRVQDSIKDMKPDTILPLGNYDIFFLKDGSKTALNLTQSKGSDNHFPYLFGSGYVCFTGDESGMTNTYIYDINRGNSYPVSDLDRNLFRHHSVKGLDKYYSVYFKDGMYQLFGENLNPQKPTNPTPTQTANSDVSSTAPMMPFVENVVVRQAPVEEKYLFQAVFDDPPVLEPIKLKPDIQNDGAGFRLKINTGNTTLKGVQPYISSRAIAANNKFGLNQITTKLDNDLLFEGLESYTGNRSQLLTTPMGFLFKANIKDLFEDYTVEGGVRIPTTFNGSEFFLVFDNKKARIDKRIAIYRKSNEYSSQVDPNQNFISRSKKTSLLGMYQMKYPFDIYRSIRATSTLRFDRFLQLSTEKNSLESPAVNEKRISLKLEYIYDNSYDAAINIKHGTRFKIYSEIINQFDLQVIDGFKLNLSKGYTGILGFDARHYIPVLSKSLLAIRAAGATSYGSQKMLYFLGGVENWLFPKFDNTIPIRNDGDFSYKANAFHLRGFDNNIRNGSTFLLSNVELRVPFFQYLLGKNQGSAFIRNMQLTCFFDAGLAWHGASPFSPENPLNKTEINSPPLIRLEIEYFRDPLVMGYGLGLRTQLLGYFVKADYAWGIETRQIQVPKFYLSLGLDF